MIGSSVMEACTSLYVVDLVIVSGKCEWWGGKYLYKSRRGYSTYTTDPGGRNVLDCCRPSILCGHGWKSRRMV